jgi:hypothetical protein
MERSRCNPCGQREVQAVNLSSCKQPRKPK